MADALYLFDGQTAGTVLTAGPGNTGASAILSGGTGTVIKEFNAAMAAPGSTVGMKVQNGIGGYCWVRLPAPSASLIGAFHGIFTTPPVDPDGTTQRIWILTPIDNAGQTPFKLIYNNARAIYFWDKVNTKVADIMTLAANTKYRIEVQWTIATSTTGQLDIQIYPVTGSTTTPLNTVGGAASHITNANLGTTAFDRCDVGLVSTQTQQLIVGWDEVIIRSGSNTPIGIYSPPANVAPVVTPPAPQRKAAGQTATLTMVATDSDGSIASVAWAATSWPLGASAPTLTNATSLTATTSALTVPGIYTFTPSATDNSTATTVGAVATVYVYAVNGTTKIRGQRSNTGAWSGAFGNLNDTDTPGSETWTESPSGPVNASIIYDMDPAADGDLKITEFIAELAPPLGAACTCKVEVLTTAADTVIRTEVVPMTGAFVNTPIILTAPENTAFVDHNLWAIRLTANQT